MKYIVDIDNTICQTPNIDGVNRYDLAEPMRDRIGAINRLYTDGHHITYWTARGSSTGVDWLELTETQLNEWGCCYHELKLGKPSYDVFICDKAWNSEDYFAQSRTNSDK